MLSLYIYVDYGHDYYTWLHHIRIKISTKTTIFILLDVDIGRDRKRDGASARALHFQCDWMCQNVFSSMIMTIIIIIVGC